MSKDSGKGDKRIEQSSSPRRKDSIEQQTKMSKQENHHSWGEIGEQRQE